MDEPALLADADQQARRLADGLRAAGYDVVNRVVLNQVLVRAGARSGATDAATLQARADALASGELWFGPTVWQGRPAFRLSVSSWRTTDADVGAAVARRATVGGSRG